MRWQIPNDVEYARIAETGPPGTHYWFTFRDFAAFIKNQPGTYTYSLQGLP